MPKLIVYYAHPGHHFSQVNAKMYAAAQEVADITCVDLYAEYPRFDISPDQEQQRLLDHDIILFQFPLFWYSTPSILKEWQDIVLEHGFAYGSGGDKLAGKSLGLAITAAGPQDAYTPQGYQHQHLRTFLTPLEQTATLCKMRFLAPYVLFGSLSAPQSGAVDPHNSGYRTYLEGLRDGAFSNAAGPTDMLTAATLTQEA